MTSPEILVNKLPIAPEKKPDTIMTIPANNADIGTKEAVIGENSNHLIKFSDGKGKLLYPCILNAIPKKNLNTHGPKKLRCFNILLTLLSRFVIIFLSLVNTS